MKTFGNVTRSPLFWISQVILLLGCIYLSAHLYPKAFPIVDLQIKMDRITALTSAAKLAQLNHWGPPAFREAASFESDDRTQTFVELSAGGTEAFSKIVKSGIYSPYYWNVRHFSEGKTEESQIRFNPQGEFYGFSERLSEDAPGQALSGDQALKIAESAAVRWKIPLDQYQLIEKSEDAKRSKRIDHTFVYERPAEKIGEGRYRLKLMVSGDRLTEIEYFVKIPESFSRHYAEMRSSNNLIAEIASVAMMILYLLGGCGFGIFFLIRTRWIIWKTPLIAAGIVAGFQFLEQINHLPLLWMNYDTALSANGFLLRSATGAFISFLSDFFLLAVSFMTAEGLSRKAFPHHPQLWRVWSLGNANSTAILGRTLGGYLSVGFFFLFVILIYIFGTQTLGWWNPSDTLFHPDGLATYCPWWTSLSNSIHAGFWEESLFRAVPLAGAAILGTRLGQRKRWIAAAFLVQALIFASAHANYPTLPSYARVIELIIPSFIFGGLYLAFGLLPGIILHFTFDVVSFSLPLFTTSSPGVWLDRTLVIFLSLIPLWIVLVARLRAGKWSELKNQGRNQGWHPEGVAKNKSELQSKDKKTRISNLQKPFLNLTPKLIYRTGAIAFLTFLVWLSLSDFRNDNPTLEITRTQATRMARTALEKSGITLTPEWDALASTANDIGPEDRFIWKTEGKQRYRELIGTYLMPPAWLIRFVRYNVSIEERAEEYQVTLIKNGEIFQIRHELPESRGGKSLEVTEAKLIAITWIDKNYKLKPNQILEISHKVFKLPSRRDWLFIFSDPSVHLKLGEARIGVRLTGDQIMSSRRFIFIPEVWERAESNKQNLLSIVRIFSILVLAMILTTGIGWSLLSWTQKQFNFRIFKLSVTFLLAINFIGLINELPGKFAQFSNVEPKNNQLISLFTVEAVKILFSCFFLALLLGFIHRFTVQFQRPLESKASKTSTALLSIFGYSLGIIGAALTSASQHLFSSASPSTGKMAALDTYLPFLNGMTVIGHLTWVTLLFAITALIAKRITQNWPQRGPLGTLFLFLFSFSLSGLGAPGFLEWITQGTSLALLLMIAIPLIIQERLQLIPLAIGSAFTLMEIRQLALRPYVGVAGESAVAILCILLGSYFLFQFVFSQRE